MLTIERKMIYAHFFGEHPFIALCVMIIGSVSGYLLKFIPGTLIAQVPLDINTLYVIKDTIVFVSQMCVYAITAYVGYLAIKKHRKEDRKKE